MNLKPFIVCILKNYIVNRYKDYNRIICITNHTLQRKVGELDRLHERRCSA